VNSFRTDIRQLISDDPESFSAVLSLMAAVNRLLTLARAQRKLYKDDEESEYGAIIDASDRLSFFLFTMGTLHEIGVILHNSGRLSAIAQQLSPEMWETICSNYSNKTGSEYDIRNWRTCFAFHTDGCKMQLVIKSLVNKIDEAAEGNVRDLLHVSGDSMAHSCYQFADDCVCMGMFETDRRSDWKNSVASATSLLVNVIDLCDRVIAEWLRQQCVE